MTYEEIKDFTSNLIKEDLNITFDLPKDVNYFNHDTSFRLFFIFKAIDYFIDLEVDKSINHTSLMVFGPVDFGPFHITKKNIKSSIKHIKEKINTQFSIEYFEDERRLGKVIIDSEKDFSENEINQWLTKYFIHGNHNHLANDLHPKGYTRINKIVTQFTYMGPVKIYYKNGLRFSLQE